jgi:hypothetical protein
MLCITTHITLHLRRLCPPLPCPAPFPQSSSSTACRLEFPVSRRLEPFVVPSFCAHPRPCSHVLTAAACFLVDSLFASSQPPLPLLSGPRPCSSPPLFSRPAPPLLSSCAPAPPLFCCATAVPAGLPACWRPAPHRRAASPLMPACRAPVPPITADCNSTRKCSGIWRR